MYHSYVMYFIQYYVSYFGDVCIDVTLSWYHSIILSISHDEMIGKQLYSASCYRVYYYVTQFSSEVTPPVMYKSRQCTYRYSNANQVWGNGQWFQRANNDTTSTNFSNERTCLSIDEDDTDTDFSRSKQQWRNPLVALLMLTKMRTSSTVNTRTTYQWKQVDSVCTHTPSRAVWGNGQFQQANDDTDIKFFLRANNNEKSHLLLLSWWYQRCGQVH